MKAKELVPAMAEEKRAAPAAKARSGRPPKEQAGEVEERILDAARKVFLERGFEGASVEEIAETARAGKPTIYARFPNKQALFAAAVTRHLVEKNRRVGSYTPTGATVEERLRSVGAALIKEVLTSDGVGLIRLAIAEARRFPDLGNSIAREARERGCETVSRLLNEVAEFGTPGNLCPVSSDRRAIAARYFCDLLLLPLFIRALAGESLETLRLEASQHVSERVAFFLAACRNGGLG
jgi:AcrR family transcriptional regulator